MSHIPTITSSNKIIKNKQTKDEGFKRATVRRALGRSKLSRSPVKPTVSTVTSTNPTITTTIANTQNSLVYERVQEEIVGPVTRSRMCRFCTPPDEGITETNHKRGKRSLSNSRFYDKKNKLSRKNQIIAPSSVSLTLTRKLRKETSLDSALADVASADQNEHSSLSEALPKESARSRIKKPAARSASQKVLPTT